MNLIQYKVKGIIKDTPLVQRGNTSPNKNQDWYRKQVQIPPNATLNPSISYSSIQYPPPRSGLPIGVTKNSSVGLGIRSLSHARTVSVPFFSTA